MSCLGIELLLYKINYLYRLYVPCDIGRPYTFTVPYSLILFTFVAKQGIKESQKNGEQVMKLDHNQLVFRFPPDDIFSFYCTTYVLM